MKTKNHFSEKLKYLLQDEEKVENINKLIKLVLIISSVLLTLSIVIILIKSIFKIEIYNQLVGIVVYGAFYSVIYGVFPIIVFFILVKLINKIQKTEMIKIKIHYSLLLINMMLIIFCTVKIMLALNQLL